MDIILSSNYTSTIILNLKQIKFTLINRNIYKLLKRFLVKEGDIVLILSSLILEQICKMPLQLLSNLIRAKRDSKDPT